MSNQSEEPADSAGEFVSKTQLKNEAKALQAFGKELLALPDAKLKRLPISANTLTALADFHKQSGNIARKRHLAYIGKCLRNDDAEAIKTALTQDSFEQMREQQESVKTSPQDELVNALVEQGDAKIQALLQVHPAIDRQNLRQLVRNVKNAKNDVKRAAASHKLKTFVNDFNLA